MGHHPVDRHVGARLRLIRLQRGLSQNAVAEGVGLTFQQVQKYERGTNRISASKLYEIAIVLGVSIGHFFEGLGGDEQRENVPTALSAMDYKILALVNQVEDLRVKRQVYSLLTALVEGDREAMASR